MGSMSQGDPPREQPGIESRLSRASVNRLSLYLHRLEGFLREGAETVSSGQLGQALGISGAQVRKDLAYLGNLGHRGIGYPAQALIAAIRRTLGIDRDWAAVLVGVGNLARALLRYRGFQQQGFRIVALFDADAGKIGDRIEGLEVFPPARLRQVVRATHAELALLTVPAEHAQAVADELVAAGISGILNFAPTVLHLPAHVSLVSVNLAIQLEQLAFRVQLARNE